MYEKGKEISKGDKGMPICIILNTIAIGFIGGGNPSFPHVVVQISSVIFIISIGTGCVLNTAQ